ncbi:Uncharacterised protein [Yersinia enterocolitica]|nr:Uncharacterised protein [Yersinia enterocolitica]
MSRLLAPPSQAGVAGVGLTPVRMMAEEGEICISVLPNLNQM